MNHTLFLKLFSSTVGNFGLTGNHLLTAGIHKAGLDVDITCWFMYLKVEMSLTPFRKLSPTFLLFPLFFL